MNNKKSLIKVARVSTISFFVVSQLKKQIEDLSRNGYQVVIVSGEDEGIDVLKRIGDKHVSIEIPREIKPFNDMLALWRLYKLFRKEKFDVVHSTTPKAGLLCSIAGVLARVSVRMHTFTGQAWATRGGLVRLISKFSDKIIIKLNHQTYADSSSQVLFLKNEKIIDSVGRIKVLGQGSLSGVNLTRFNKENWKNKKNSLREEFGIPSDSKVLLFLGRVARDKGIKELLEAFNKVCAIKKNVYLFIVGPEEKTNDPVLTKLISSARHNPVIRFQSYTTSPEKYLALSDIMCLPSYREGFGTVVIEAAAMGVPTVGTEVQGLVDSVINHETGILVPAHDSDSLAQELLSLLSNEELLLELGKNAHQRAVEFFASDTISQYVMQEYDKFLHING